MKLPMKTFAGRPSETPMSVAPAATLGCFRGDSDGFQWPGPWLGPGPAQSERLLHGVNQALAVARVKHAYYKYDHYNWQWLHHDHHGSYTVLTSTF